MRDDKILHFETLNSYFCYRIHLVTFQDDITLIIPLIYTKRKRKKIAIYTPII